MADGIQDKIRSEMNAYFERLDETTRKQVSMIQQHFHTLSDLLMESFDYQKNASLRFEYSVIVANQFVGQSPILKSLDDVDDYFLS